MANTTLLSWINAEVERALALVRESIAKFSAAPENDAVLHPCPDHLHQVSGALRMVGLSGATLVCETIEGSFAGFSGARPSAAAMGVIDRAVVALKDFVGDLARGQADVPLRLFPVYRDLAGLLGKSPISEKDLFFPDLALEGPAHPNPRVLPAEELAPFLQAQRARFQRGLLAWLRGGPAGLVEMRQVLDALHQAAAQLPEPRALWWAAGALIDTLGQRNEASETQWLAVAKAACNRMDFQMRDLAAGSAKSADGLLRELLFALAKRKPATPRIKEVKQLYQLDGLFPPPEKPAGVLEFDIEGLEVALYDMHSRLDALKRAWVHYVAGEHKTAGRFRELVTAFRGKAKDLGNQHFIKLLDAIALVAAKLPDPYPRQNQMLVIEMASAFILVEHVIDNFSSPADDLGQQIAIMGGWLLDAEQGKSTGEPPAGLRPDLSERIGTLQLRSQVAKEILANLQHVEQVLDAFARDSAKRGTLGGLQPYLRQIHGALAVLGLTRAAEAVSICEGMILDCAKVGHARSAEDMDWIAEGLSSVGFFLEPCRHGREPADEAIALFFRRYEKRDAPPSLDTTMQIRSPVMAAAEVLKPAEASAAAPPALHPGVDPDLLAVFLEEAGELLQTIERSLPECRQQPDNHETLTTMRRAFHTLKGSGRMVGLTDLGEVAWEVEQVMNHWLEQKRPATPRLLELISVASNSFKTWLEQLRGQGHAGAVDAKPIHELAEAARIEEPSSDDVTFGSVTLPRTFYGIYTKEAAEHVARLEAQCGEWREAPGAEASHEFMRAAHTLASSSRTAGFGEIADLAGALEQWTGFARQTTAAADVEVVQAAIASLRTMVEAVVRREAPATGEAPGGRLRELIARLEAHPPPVEAKIVPVDAKPAIPPGGRESRRMHDDIDEQMLPIFAEEAQQLVPSIGADLRDWKANPADEKVSQSLRRSLHTLKGSARMAGAIRLGELCHIMESRIEEAVEANAFPAVLFEDLEERMDRLSLDVERMRAGPSPQAAAPVAVAGPVPQARAELPLPGAAAMLRVNADTLDHLINESGEVVIARSRVEAELRVIKQSLSDLGDSIARLRSQLREVEVQADSQMQSRQSVVDDRNREFDPLEFDRYTRLQELTRMMAESLNDVISIQQALHKNVGDTDAALQHQARISRDVQQELMRVRAVPFANLNERLYRIVRQTSRELDKKAELKIEGAEVELDRSVLERIGAPLEHMLRNALAHGLEAPAARAAAGKPEAGRIAIALRQESNEIALILSDDGAGLDLDALRRKGLEMGLLPADREPTERELMKLVFAPGLSTAEEVTELSGRGVGMEVVRNEISGIGGRVDIATVRGQGTTFTVYLPLTLAVTQAVLVRSGAAVIAISSAMVEQVLRLKGDMLLAYYAKKTVSFKDHSHPLHYMQHLLGVAGPPGIQPYNSVLLVRSGIQRIALHVDELVGNQEIVVKNIGPQLARVPGIAGATVLADGTIAPIMNPVQLAQRAAAAPAAPAVVAPAPAKAAAPVVMVVDDSLTVRKITGRLLEREGYVVVTAKDGVDALEQLRDSLPKVMLVDIEMPRMDGFDLTRNVRGDARTQGIPIIFITSRTAEKHRNQAAQLGVNAFLGKPYPEAELLQLVAKYTAA